MDPFTIRSSCGIRGSRRGRAKYRDFLITARKVAAIFARSVLTTIGIQGWRTDTKASP
jgi:hypothetical protein